MKWIPLIGALALVAGCGSLPQTGGPSGPQPEYSVENRLRGRIVDASPKAGFVVMDFSVAGLPPVGAVVDVMDSDQVVGRVRVSGPARDNIIAGDMLSGEIRKGQEVVYTPDPVE